MDVGGLVYEGTSWQKNQVVSHLLVLGKYVAGPINVNLAGKTDLIAIKNSESPYVVTWPSQPTNVDFVLDAQSYANGYRIVPEAGGLRLLRYTGIIILVR